MAVVKLSACVEMIFRNVPEFVDRIDKVAETGLKAFEFWGWSNKDLPAIRERADKCGIDLACFGGASSAPMVDPECTAQWIKDAEVSIAKAKEFGCPSLIATTGNELPIAREIQHKAIVACLKGIAPAAEAQGITIVLEPLNILVNRRHYLSTSNEASAILRVNSPRVKLCTMCTISRSPRATLSRPSPKHRPHRPSYGRRSGPPRAAHRRAELRESSGHRGHGPTGLRRHGLPTGRHAEAADGRLPR